MEITWLGHASFHVVTSQTHLLFDPFPSELGINPPPRFNQANVVFESSSHPFHSAEEAVELNENTKVLRDPGEYEVSGLHVQAIRTTRHTPSGELQNWNTAFSISSEGLNLCHVGNPNRLLNAQEVERLGSPQVLLLPVGCSEGLSPGLAAELVNIFEPRVIIPMLFAHPGNRAPGLRDLESFLSEIGGKSIETISKLSITRANLPEEQTLVVLNCVSSPA